MVATFYNDIHSLQTGSQDSSFRVAQPSKEKREVHFDPSVLVQQFLSSIEKLWPDIAEYQSLCFCGGT